MKESRLNEYYKSEHDPEGLDFASGVEYVIFPNPFTIGEQISLEARRLREVRKELSNYVKKGGESEGKNE